MYENWLRLYGLCRELLLYAPHTKTNNGLRYLAMCLDFFFKGFGVAYIYLPVSYRIIATANTLTMQFIVRFSHLTVQVPRRDYYKIKIECQCLYKIHFITV